MSDDLVACTWCGVVYIVEIAAKKDRCQTCDNSQQNTTPIPSYGDVYKWWDWVDE